LKAEFMCGKTSASKRFAMIGSAIVKSLRCPYP
jgi:hypothetical protein